MDELAVTVAVELDETAVAVADDDVWIDLARSVLRGEGIRGQVEVAVEFVDEDRIAELNRRFMGVDGPTDVLSFPLERLEDRHPHDPSPLLLGDVVVCPAVAVRNADDAGRDRADEVALLVVHGLLHLVGHDHVEPDERAEMWARQDSYLRTAGYRVEAMTTGAHSERGGRQAT